MVADFGTMRDWDKDLDYTKKGRDLRYEALNLFVVTVELTTFGV